MCFVRTEAEIALRREYLRKDGYKRETVVELPPVTPAGNALKHGLCSRRVVARGEDARIYQQLREEVEAEWRPRSVTEWVLTEQIAQLTWNLLRAQSADTRILASFQAVQDDAEMYAPADLTLANRVERRSLQTVQIYIGRIERSLHRAIHRLMDLRRRKRKMGKLRYIWTEQNSAEAEDAKGVALKHEKRFGTNGIAPAAGEEGAENGGVR